ncbi:hypothetical protein GYMLUDRAFT_702462 [Collybiopsis luxurians FD-317 M1]|uniref:Unplaced genomic scaffold GYMLUscaffold_38, whole genome shotgun sequence n=1 Tax=Collybiopsis luxurians FD-317 M1 TaxID=944289 RepID=A0A0D0CRQ0_9AGAR|nr:hypothetical protein GYMLUDRAFT_702462 [Collybiopsis luxurians FD-317 M1]
MDTPKKSKKWINKFWSHKGNKTNTPELPKSTPELGNIVQDSRSLRSSGSNVSVLSDPIPGRVQECSGHYSSQPLAVEEQSPSKSLTQHQALQTAGAVAEKGLKILGELSGFIPVAGKGLGIALGVVSEYIQIYHQVSENKERFKELTEELSIKVTEVMAHIQDSKSTEMKETFEILAKYELF